MRKPGVFASLLLVASIAACGGGSSGERADAGGEVPDAGGGGDLPDGNGSGGVPTLADLCGPGGMFERFVLEAYRCQPELAFATAGVPSSTEIQAACAARYASYLERADVALGSRAAFDACAQFLTTDGCATIGLDEPSPCDALVTGTLATGSACDVSVQCTAADHCDTRGAGACGACAPRKPLDAPCDAGDECQSHRCSAAGLCKDLGAMGAPCDTREDCIGSSWCDTALTCQPQPTWAPGVPCGDALDCGAIGGAHYCDPGTGMCQAYANLTEPCGASAGGRRCKIYEQQVCVSGAGGSTCVMATLGAAGTACQPYGVDGCQAGLRCADHDGSGGTPRQCTAPPQADEPCDALDSTCDAFLTCSAGVCSYGPYTETCPI